MTRAQLLAGADSYELSQWAAFLRVEAEERQAAGDSTAVWPGLTGGA